MSILQPSKHTNLKCSILNVSGIILKILKENNSIIEYNELFELLKQEIGNDIGDFFLLSLSFLFIHMKLEYSPELDSIRLINETL